MFDAEREIDWCRAKGAKKTEVVNPMKIILVLVLVWLLSPRLSVSAVEKHEDEDEQD
jgi:hypothetical protein